MTRPKTGKRCDLGIARYATQLLHGILAFNFEPHTPLVGRLRRFQRWRVRPATVA